MKTLKLRKAAIDTYKENVAYLHRGCAEGGLERDEILYLTEAMVETGKILDWGEPWL